VQDLYSESGDFGSVSTEVAAIGPNGEQTLQYDSELGSLVVTE